MCVYEFLKSVCIQQPFSSRIPHSHGERAFLTYIHWTRMWNSLIYMRYNLSGHIDVYIPNTHSIASMMRTCEWMDVLLLWMCILVCETHSDSNTFSYSLRQRTLKHSAQNVWPTMYLFCELFSAYFRSFSVFLKITSNRTNTQV